MKNKTMFEVVKEHIEQTQDIETLKKMLLDTLDNAKDARRLSEEIYYNYIQN